MLPIEVPAGFRIIAHRGASAYAPENTAAAFDLAREMEVGDVETDAQLTTDGIVFLCHDLTLDRYGHPGCVLEEMPAPDLVTLDMGAWFSPYLYPDERLMTLPDLLARHGRGFVYHIELKGVAPDLPAAVREVVGQTGLDDACVYTSFAYDHLARMREIDSDARLGWLIGVIDDASLQRAEEIDLFQLCPRAAEVTGEAVERARAAVTEVRAWGLGGPSSQVVELIGRIAAAGCDGATVNWPDWLVHA